MKARLTLLALLFSALVLPVSPARSQDDPLQAGILFADSLIRDDPREFFRNVRSLIVYDHGVIRLENYYHGAGRENLSQIQSQTKSIVSLLLGIAIDKGFIRDENVRVADYYPDEFAHDSLKSQVTIRDLITMTAGFRWEEMIPMDDPANDNIRMFRSGHWLDYALNRPMAAKPYTAFRYNSGCPMIVAGIIEQATGKKLDRFAEEYLFSPLDIKTFNWLKDSTGFCHAGGGLFLKPSDMLRIGIMVLQDGRYGKTQVVSSGWIKRSVEPRFQTEFSGKSYGYFWWIKDMPVGGGKTTRVVSAEGAGGQNLYILPEFQLILATTEQNYTTPQVGPMVLQQSILPNLR